MFLKRKLCIGTYSLCLPFPCCVATMTHSASQEVVWWCGGVLKNVDIETTLVVEWLRLHPHNAGGLGFIPGQETRSHMPQLRPSEAK